MKEKVTIQPTFDILRLQNLLKKDPPSYYDEFFQQYQHYKSLLELFQHNPSEHNKSVEDLVQFLAHVSPYYKDVLKDFPAELMNLLRKHGSALDPTMRMCFLKALILARNKGCVEPLELIKLCFELLGCRDKILRKQLQIHIVSDLKNINAKHKNAAVNSTLQNFMFKMLADGNATAVKMSLDIMTELYRKNVWKDSKTVNAIATACFSKHNKVLVAAHNFFLGVDEEDENDGSDSEDDNKPNLKDVMMANRFNKKSRSRKKQLERTKRVLKKSKKKTNTFDFSAIHLLQDPQGMAEKLLQKVQSMHEGYEIKLLIMNVISRLIGVHELVLFNFYDFLIRYLKPHQVEVTKILMFAAQASHTQVPPEAIEPVVKCIANGFISERNSPELITVGLNAIREICMRCPLAIDQDLLQDLVQYSSYKNKNVVMSARLLVHLFRRIAPKMLQRKFRSRPTEATKDAKLLEFGASDAKSYIPGSEALSVDPSMNDVPDEEKPEDEDSDEEGWVDVSHHEDEEETISEPPQQKTEKRKHSKKAISRRKMARKRAMQKKTKDDMSETASTNDGPSSTTANDTLDKAMTVSQSRILSQEEFHKLRVAQIAKQVQFTKGKKRKAEESLDELFDKNNEIVSLRDIEKLHKRPKGDKESRLATVLEGREGREKFGQKKKKRDVCSKNKKENKKNKAFMMIKYKVKSKTKRSFRDKQMALKKSLLKFKRNQ